MNEDLKYFFDSLDWAKKNGLHYEFMETFLQQYVLDKKLDDAIWHALYEWDL